MRHQRWREDPPHKHRWVRKRTAGGGIDDLCVGIGMLRKTVHPCHLDGWVAGMKQEPSDEIAVLLQK